MRKFLAVAVLGTVLAVGAGTAFASDTVDYRGPYHYQGVQVPQHVQATFPDENQTGSMVAGGDSGSPFPYQQERYENFGH